MQDVLINPLNGRRNAMPSRVLFIYDPPYKGCAKYFRALRALASYLLSLCKIKPQVKSSGKKQNASDVPTPSYFKTILAGDLIKFHMKAGNKHSLEAGPVD